MSLLSGDPRSSQLSASNPFILGSDLLRCNCFMRSDDAIEIFIIVNYGYAQQSDLAIPNLVAAGASVYGELELLLLSSAARSKALTIE